MKSIITIGSVAWGTAAALALVLTGTGCGGGSSGSKSDTPQPTSTLVPVSTPTASPSPGAGNTDLGLTVTADDSFLVGNEGTYTVMVTNFGPVASSGVFTVHNELPAGITLAQTIAPDWTCSASGAQIDCSSDELLVPDESSTIVLIVEVGSQALPSVSNDTSLDYAADSDTGNNSATVQTPVQEPLADPETGETDLSMVKNDISTFTVGDEGLYRLQVSNLGPAQTDATIMVTDNLPTGLTFISIDHPDYSCNVNGGNISCQSDVPLDPGAVSSLIVTTFVEASAYPTVTNTAVVSYPKDTNSANDVGNRPTTIRMPKAP